MTSMDHDLDLMIDTQNGRGTAEDTSSPPRMPPEDDDASGTAGGASGGSGGGSTTPGNPDAADAGTA